jgi:hypothetical protein
MVFDACVIERFMSKVAELLKLLTCIVEVPTLSLSWDKEYPNFCVTNNVLIEETQNTFAANLNSSCLLVGFCEFCGEKCYRHSSKFIIHVNLKPFFFYQR